MFFRNCRFNNVANLDDGTLELELCIFGASSACRQKLRYGTAAFQDDYSLSGGLNTVENRQALSLEIGCADGLHMTSIRDSASHVNQKCVRLRSRLTQRRVDCRASHELPHLCEAALALRASLNWLQWFPGMPQAALLDVQAEVVLFSEEGEPQHAGGPVGPLQLTEVAQRKDRTRRTADGSLPVQSLADLLAGLGTLSAVELGYEQVPGYAVPTLSELEPLHELVFELLGF